MQCLIKMCSTDNVRKAIRDREYRELLETTEEKQRKGTLAARENVAMQVYICLYFAVVFFFVKKRAIIAGLYIDEKQPIKGKSTL